MSAILSTLPPPSSRPRGEKPTAATLRREFQELEHPGLRKCEASLRIELCEDHAAKAFALGLEALGETWTLRRVGKHLKVSERMVRDYKAGFRSPPLAKILALPQQGRLAAIRYLVSVVPELEIACG